MRTLYCKWDGCARPYYETCSEDLPSVCHSCGRMGKWLIIPEDPKMPWELTLKDRRLLRAMRIDPEEKPLMSEDDGA